MLARNDRGKIVAIVEYKRRIVKKIIQQIDSMKLRDPAARSRWEIVFSYPGFHILFFYRTASCLWHHRLYFLARWVSHWGRWCTGIEIHPAAKIGKRLFIDHGMGVVIGETAEIEDDVTLYHAVTLGGVAPAVNALSQINRKRHPTLKNGVIIGAGAQILGPITIGRNARVGANAVVLHDVPEDTTVSGIPARALHKPHHAANKFAAYGIPDHHIPDPILHILENQQQEILELKKKMDMFMTVKDR